MPATPTYCANRSTGLSGAEPSVPSTLRGRRRPLLVACPAPTGNEQRRTEPQDNPRMLGRLGAVPNSESGTSRTA